jgi:CBS domain-containing protein
MKTKTGTRGQHVADVFSKDVVAVTTTDTVRDALTLMVENRVSALPVVSGKGVCVGIISATDLIALTRDLNEDWAQMQTGDFSNQWLLDQLAAQDFGRRRVEELMTEVVETVRPESTLVHAGRLMLRHHVHRLPVVNEEAQLLGIVSMTDLLAAFVDGEV